MTVIVEGARELAAELGQHLAQFRPAVSGAVVEAAAAAAGEMRSRVRRRTGAVHDSITSDPAAKAAAAAIYADAGPEHFVSWFLEYGTMPHKIGSRQHPGTAPYPFVNPAADAVMAKFAEHIENVTMRSLP